MDMSKLPRLSNTAENVPPSQPENSSTLPPHDQPIPARSEPPYSEPAMTQGMLMGAEAWLSIVIGIILLLLTSRFLQFLAGKITHAEFSWEFNDAAGNPLAYSQTVFFWNDLGLVIFALCLIFEGLVLGFLRHPFWLKLGFALTLAAIALNLFTVAKSLPVVGFQFMPALAIAFGVYIGMHEWALLKAARR